MEDHPYRIIRHGHPLEVLAVVALSAQRDRFANARIRPSIQVAGDAAEMSAGVGNRLDALA